MSEIRITFDKRQAQHLLNAFSKVEFKGTKAQINAVQDFVAKLACEIDMASIQRGHGRLQDYY